jgi:hypothetical protein
MGLVEDGLAVIQGGAEHKPHVVPLDMAAESM